MDETVLIGGPADGIRVRVREEVPWIQYPERYWPAEFIAHGYRRERIRTDREDYILYISEDLSLDEALVLLVKHYRPGEQHSA